MIRNDVDYDEFEELLEQASFAMLEGDVDDALEIYDEAAVLADSEIRRADCQAGRAAVLIARGEYDDAINTLVAALELYGDAAPAAAWGNLAFALDKNGYYEEALEAHRSCVELHAEEDGPTHPRTLHKRGDLAYPLIGLGRLDEAEATLREVVDGFATQPDREPLWYVQARINLGYFLFRSRRDPIAALDELDRAEALRDVCTLEINGRVIQKGFSREIEVTLLRNRAEVCDALGRRDEATELRTRADRVAATTG